MEWPSSAPRPHIPCAQGSLESCRRGEHFAHNMCRLRLRAPAVSGGNHHFATMPEREGADGTFCAQNVRLVYSFPGSPARTGCAAAALSEATPFSRPSSLILESARQVDESFVLGQNPITNTMKIPYTYRAPGFGPNIL